MKTAPVSRKSQKKRKCGHNINNPSTTCPHCYKLDKRREDQIKREGLTTYANFYIRNLPERLRRIVIGADKGEINEIKGN